MGLLSRLFSSVSVTDQHAVLVHLMIDDDIGFDSIAVLEDAIDAAITRQHVGRFEGNILSPDIAILHCFGADADRLVAAIRPVVEDFGAPAGSYILKRYGPVDDPATMEVVVEL